ncbi:MAG: DUF4238 domain-containing protein [Thalassolituus sp.]|uniref:DUF4238 domain-containing protein n=1 Tax=Thalassolituus sp. TaxID=2030822 RepID=UPI003982C259
MNKQISKKHHFIPQFYIKGFSDENGDVFVFDKEYKKLASSPKKSAQIFYEENLYTVKKFGETSLLIEDSYGELEGMFSKLVAQMKEWPESLLPGIVKETEFSKLVILMLSVQYWRNPKNTGAAKILLPDLVSLYDKAIETNGEVMPFTRKDMKFYQKKYKDEAAQKFMQFLILPLITFKFHPAQLEGLEILKLDDKHEFLCSDNPVMIDSIDSEFNFQGQVFYPLTKKFAISNIKYKELSEIDKVVLSHAKKKVIASSTERLQSLLQV